MYSTGNVCNTLPQTMNAVSVHHNIILQLLPLDNLYSKLSRGIYFSRLPKGADDCPKERMTINPNEDDRIAQSVEL